MDILEVFWTNVDWHVENKGLQLRKGAEIARRKRSNITLKIAGEIAKALDIDDYAILFEEVESQ